MASEEMHAAIKAMREGPRMGGEFDVHATRAMSDAAPRAQPPDDVTFNDFEAGGIRNRHIQVPAAREDRGVLYFHGGGYAILSVESHTELMGRISRACTAPVLGIDYRLAPEHPYPAAVEDAVAAYDRLLARGIDASQIVIGGDSAGGGLTVACMLALKEQGKPLPAGAFLISPWADLTCSGDSYQTRVEQDPMLADGKMLRAMSGLYADDTDPADPGMSPVFGDLSGLPPMLIQVGDYEVLLDDATRLTENGESAGVDVELQIFECGYHVFQMNPVLPESAEAVASMGAFFDRVTQ